MQLVANTKWGLIFEFSHRPMHVEVLSQEVGVCRTNIQLVLHLSIRFYDISWLIPGVSSLHPATASNHWTINEQVCVPIPLPIFQAVCVTECWPVYSFQKYFDAIKNCGGTPTSFKRSATSSLVTFSPPLLHLTHLTHTQAHNSPSGHRLHHSLLPLAWWHETSNRLGPRYKSFIYQQYL